MSFKEQNFNILQLGEAFNKAFKKDDKNKKVIKYGLQLCA